MKFDFEDLDLGEEWKPTTEQFARYRAREIALAKDNCAFIAREHGMSSVRPSNTLHTKHVIRDANKVSDPRRVAMGSFMAGFQGFLAEKPL